MFTGDEEGPAVVDVTEKVSGAKIAVFNPQITRLHRLEKRPEQRAFLGMAIFTGKDIGHQTLSGLIDHQGFARQGPPGGLPQLFYAMVTRFETVPIDNFDPIAFKPKRTNSADVWVSKCLSLL